MINSQVLLAAAAVIILSLALSAHAADRRSKAGKYWVYVGTYTGPASKGIHLAEFDANSGDLQYRGLAAEGEQPTFICADPSLRYVYSADETYGPKGGTVTAFQIDTSTGKLNRLSQAPSAGNGPCHVSVDGTGRVLMVANYGSGSFASMPIDPNGGFTRPGTTIQHTGGSGVVKRRQEGPHAHGIYPDPSGKYALAVDLGTDTVSAYKMNVTDGTLGSKPAAVANTAPGAGPRHLAFSPDGRFVYVTMELNNTIEVYAWDAAKPAFTLVQTIGTLPDGFAGKSATAEVAVHPDAKTVYVSNRGADNIAFYRRNAESGLLTMVGAVSSEGGDPRHFEIDPTGRWMLVGNQKGNNLVLLGIEANGDLKSTGKQLPISAAVCAIYIPRQ